VIEDDAGKIPDGRARCRRPATAEMVFGRWMLADLGAQREMTSNGGRASLRPPSRRGRSQARLVVASSAALTSVSAALTSVSAAPTASAWIGLTGGCSAHRPALGRALGGRDVRALWRLGLRLSLLLALIAL
jgi:hypothetical protein